MKTIYSILISFSFTFFYVITVQNSKAQSWSTVGTAGFSSNVADFTSIAVDGSGTPYVAFMDAAYSYKATVMKYNGSSWVPVGSAGFSAGQADYTTIAFDGSGTPYVVFMDGNNGNKATVMKYTGSSWVIVGSAGFSPGEAQVPTIAINASGTPYVAFEDYGNSEKATVMKFNGSSWVTVGSAGFSAGQATDVSVAIGGSGTPYVVYEDYSNSYKATVMKFNGVSWVNVGSPGFSAGVAGFTSIAIDGSGTPYVVYQDEGTGIRATVKKYNGSSWVTVGSAGFSAGVVDYTKITIGDSAMPYVVYEDVGSSQKATVMKFNGSSWVNVGSAGISTGIVAFTSIAIDNSGIPYVAYSDNDVSNKATVMKFTPSPPSPIEGVVDVCPGTTITLTDSTAGGTWSASNSNVIVDSNGVVVGISAGLDTISYTVGGSSVTAVISVDPLPNAGVITGAYSVSIGSSITLTDAATGGVWFATNGNASIVSGVVTGVSGGVDTILYQVANYCGVTTTMMEITVTSGTTSCGGIITTIAGNGTAGYSGDGGSATAAAFNAPSGVVKDKFGNIYLDDEDNNLIRKISASGIVSTVGGGGSLSGIDNIPATSASFSYTRGLSIDTFGNLYFFEACCGRVRKIDAFGIVKNVATGLGWSWSVYADNNKNVYVPVEASNIIVKIDTLGTITTVAGVGTVGFSGDGGQATDAALYAPAQLVVDASGSIIFADHGNNRIRKIDPFGIITTIAGSGATGYTGGGYTGDGGMATDATFYTTNCVTYDNLGNLFISDGNNVVRMVNTSGIITTVAGTGVFGFSGDGGPATNATLSVGSIYMDNANSLFICDPGNHRIREVSSSVMLSAIFGSSSVTIGSSITLIDTTTGGTWSASNSHATVSSSGIVTGVTSGIDTISYTVTNSCGSAVATHLVTVLGPVSAISGPNTLCVGSVITLEDSVSGGTWSSRNGDASVSSSGVVTGVTPGLDTITYTNGIGVATMAITVYPSPNPITGYSSICPFVTYNYSDSTWGGTWSTAAASVTINPITGTLVAGFGSGTATISYTLTSGCYVSKNLTFNHFPYAGIISGPDTICVGSTVTYIDTSSTGISTFWNETGSGIILSSTGVVTGLSVGLDTISYTLVNGCGVGTAHKIIHVIPATAGSGVITGISALCTGSTATLTDTVSGGAWSATNSHASVNSLGVVTPVSAGMDTIRYAVGGGACLSVASHVISIDTTVTSVSISGFSTLNAGTNISLSASAGGGIWSASNGHATVGSSGLVSGISAGIDTIHYIISNACGTASATKIVTVYSCVTSSGISGANYVCAGSAISLTDPMAGGVWSISNTHATIDSTGVVTGITGGYDTVSYSYANSCATGIATYVIHVYNLPTAAAITGSPTVCNSAHDTLHEATTGGTWSSNNTAIATVSTGGLVLGVSAGTVIISYSVTNICGTAIAAKNVTVNSLPAAGSISGVTNVCPGGTITLTESLSGGTWSTTNTSATVAGGVVTGVVTGTDTILYSVTNVCGTRTVTKQVIVHSPPVAGAIVGLSSLTAGSYTPMTDSVVGGVWSCSNGNATINSAGIVSGLAAGMDTITYIVSAPCGTSFVVKIITINPCSLSSGISGDTAVCVGNSTTLSDMTMGGVWNSLLGHVSITSGGAITGVSSGQDTILYSYSNVCGSGADRYVIQVAPAPYAGVITGAFNACVGTTISLTDSGGIGGVWSASNSNVALTGGAVTALAVGSSNISYTAISACGTSSTVITFGVFPLPNSGVISGGSTVCAGNAIGLSETVLGGTWSASNGHAVISGGIVNGISGGIDTINYSVSNGCGGQHTSHIVTVNPGPNTGTISGTDTLCPGASVILSETVSGGTWSVTNSHATVVSGVVTAITAGIDTISYSVTNSCGSASASYPVTVNAMPDAGSITGSNSVCVNATVTLGNAATGGTWGITNSHATDSMGVVKGISAGMDTVNYTVINSCGLASASKAITVNQLPDAGSIIGSSTVCVGETTIFLVAVTGGSWSLSNTHATDSFNYVRGISAGIDTLTYTVSNVCGTAHTDIVITVNPLPNAGFILGSNIVCTGSTITLHDSASVGSGSWSVSNSHAAVSGTGVVTGLSTGVDTVIYTATNSCGPIYAKKSISVSTIPSAGTISGIDTVCVGGATSLSETVTGGIWSVKNANASISGGTIVGVHRGNDTVLYTMTNICGSGNATFPIYIDSNLVPAISGYSFVCLGSYDTLTGNPPGGVWSASNGSAVLITDIVLGVTGGIDTLNYTVSNRCGSETATMYLSVFTTHECDSVLSNENLVSAGERIKIFPNPTDGQFAIELPQTGTDVAIVITDVYGKIVATEIVKNNSELKLNYDMTFLPRGTYLVKVVVDGKVHREKLVVW